MPTKKNITQEDIARRLRVSRITVSKALRGHDDISETMKEKVLSTARKMGYTPNLVASNLSRKKTNMVGIVIPDLENSFYAYLSDTIIDELSEAGYTAIITVSREKEESERENILTLLGLRVDGLLVCTSQSTRDKDLFDLSARMGTPLVFFDRIIRDAGSGSVAFDDREGTLNALDSLINAGFTKIAHFAGYSSVSVGRIRSAAFRFALRKRGIEIKSDWIIEGGFEVEDGYNAFMKIADRNELPQLVFAVNDRVALGAYKAASVKGLKIPQDISVAGFGFRETTEMFSPPLAVINQEPRRMGAEAVRILTSEIRGLKHEKHVLIPVNFIKNKSVHFIKHN